MVPHNLTVSTNIALTKPYTLAPPMSTNTINVIPLWVVFMRTDESSQTRIGCRSVTIKSCWWWCDEAFVIWTYWIVQFIMLMEMATMMMRVRCFSDNNRFLLLGILIAPTTAGSKGDKPGKTIGWSATASHDWMDSLEQIKQIICKTWITGKKLKNFQGSKKPLTWRVQVISWVYIIVMEGNNKQGKQVDWK